MGAAAREGHLARLAQCAASMTLGHDVHRPFDPPDVLDRLRENLALVDVICDEIRRHLGRTLPRDDLGSYGREGLLTAARTFDPTRGVPFPRWANIRIRGAILDGIRAHSTLPRTIYARLRALDAELETRVDDFLAVVATEISIGFAGVNMADHGEPTDGAPSAEERFAEAELDASIRESIRRLPHAERALLERHYFDDVTFEQAASELGLSKSWASRLHARAVETVGRRLKRAAPPEPRDECSRPCAQFAERGSRTPTIRSNRGRERQGATSCVSCRPS